MDIKETIKKNYINIEDKWFNLLDTIEEKIPVYKVVDPIEKAGIPSLLVFSALLLIIFYVAFLTMSGSPYQININNQAGTPIPATITIFNEGGSQIKNIETENGMINLRLKQGDYSLDISSADCDSLINEPFSVFEGIDSSTFELKCSGIELSSSGTFCFTPDGLGEISLKKYSETGDLIDESPCGQSECTSEIKSIEEYQFKADGYITNTLNYDKLNKYLDNSQCIEMKEAVYKPKNPQPVTILVQNEQGVLFQSAKVELVNPDNENKVLYERTTNEMGRALFDNVELGTKFMVKVQGTETTISYLHNETYETPLGGLTETIIVTTATSSQIKVSEQSNFGKIDSNGAVVTVIDETEQKIINQDKTNSTGIAILGVEKGKAYKLAVWKNGFTYEETEITGGDDKEITIRPNLANEVGKIKVKTTLEGEVLKEALIILKHSSKIPTGILAPLTNSNGITEFKNVPPGEYCVTVNRNEGKESQCEPVTVKAGERNEVIIDLTKINYNIKLKILNEQNETIDDAEVKVINLDEETEVCNGNSFDGDFECEVIEGTNAMITVSYTEGGEKYGASETIGRLHKNIDSTMILTKIAIEAKIIGIKNSYTDDFKTDSLEAGTSIYEAVVSIGLPDYEGEKWKKVEFEITEETGAIAFYSGDDAYFKSDEIVSSQKTFEMTNYDTETATQITVPLLINSINTDSGEYTLKLKARWISKTGASFSYPSELDYSEFKINITAQECDTVSTFAVCYSVLQDGAYVNPLVAGTLDFDVNDNIEIEMDIINEGSDFSGEITLEDKYESTISNPTIGATITRTSPIQTNDLVIGRDYTFNDYGINIKQRSETELKKGERFDLSYTGTALIPGESRYSIDIGGTEVDLNLRLFISGEETASLVVVEEDEIYDLSESITFYLESINGEKIDVWRYIDTGSKLTGGIEGGDITINYFNDYNNLININDDNTITIYFENDIDDSTFGHYLRDKESLTFDLKGTTIVDINEGKSIKSCIGIPAIAPIIVQKDDYCTINLGTVTDSSATMSSDTTNPVPYCNTGNSWTIKFENKCSATQSTDLPLVEITRTDEGGDVKGNVIDKASNYIQYSYGGESPPIGFDAANPSASIDLKISTKFESESGTLEKTVNTTLKLTAMRKETAVFGGLEEGTFSPLKVADYANPNCNTPNYCTVEQFANYIKTDLNDFSSFGSKVYSANLLIQNDKNSLNLLEFATVLKKVTGLTTTVVTSDNLPGTGVVESPTKIYILDTAASSSSDEVLGEMNLISVIKNSAGNYYEIDSIENLGTGLSEDVGGVQLAMPYTESTLFGTDLQDKLSVNYEIQESVTTALTDTEKTEIKTAFDDLIKAQYGLTTTPTYSATAKNKIILGVCETDSTSYSTDKDDITKLCGKYEIYTGDASAYSSIIIKDTLETQNIYIIGQDKDSLVDMLKRFKSTVTAAKEGTPVDELELQVVEGLCYDPADSPCTEESASYFDSYFLSRASSNYKVFCEGITCETSGTWDADLETALKDFAGKIKDYEPTLINLIKEDNYEDANLIISSTDSSNTHYTTFETAFQTHAGWIELSPPENGYYFTSTTTSGENANGNIVLFAKDLETATATLGRENPPQMTMSELNEELISLISDLEDNEEKTNHSLYINITGTDCYIQHNIERAPLNNELTVSFFDDTILTGWKRTSTVASEPIEVTVITGYNGFIPIYETKTIADTSTITYTNLDPTTYLITINEKTTDANKDYGIYAKQIETYGLTEIISSESTITGQKTNYLTSCTPEDVEILPDEEVTPITLAELIQVIWEGESGLTYGPYYITDNQFKITNLNGDNKDTGAITGLGDWYTRSTSWKPGKGLLWKSPICNIGNTWKDKGDIGEGGDDKEWEVISWDPSENVIHTTTTNPMTESSCIDEVFEATAYKGDVVKVKLTSDYQATQGHIEDIKVQKILITKMNENICPEGSSFEPPAEGTIGGKCIPNSDDTVVGETVEPVVESVVASDYACIKPDGFSCSKDGQGVGDAYNADDPCGYYSTSTYYGATQYCAIGYVCGKEAINTPEEGDQYAVIDSRCCPSDKPTYDETTDTCS